MLEKAISRANLPPHLSSSPETTGRNTHLCVLGKLAAIAGDGVHQAVANEAIGQLPPNHAAQHLGQTGPGAGLFLLFLAGGKRGVWRGESALWLLLPPPPDGGPL